MSLKVPLSVLWCLVFAVSAASAQSPLLQVQTLPAPVGPAPAAVQDQVDPQPAHTGWKSLLKDTGSDFVWFPKRKSTWVILGAGAAAALAVHPADDYVAEHIVGNDAVDNFFVVGKWLGSAPVQIGASVGLWAVGRYIVPPAAGEPRTNKISHLGFDLLRVQFLSQALVHGIKYTVRRDRPSGECCSFPSGHATSAFAAAAVLERHFGYRGSWPALLGATYVAASRMVDKKHFLSDVVFGAALGTASGWTVVGRHGREQYAMYPVPTKGGMMIVFSRVQDDERTH